MPAAASAPLAERESAKVDDSPSDPVGRQTAVSFAANSAVLTAQAKRALDRAMPWARQADRIVISGRTDNLGSEHLNQRLAFARALAVREYIRDQIPLVNNVIAIDARGACCFVASNATAQGRSRNRRVEVVFRGLHAHEVS
jgi:outer membrane protein OmpA-like peptidoglycan-associated protein